MHQAVYLFYKYCILVEVIMVQLYSLNDISRATHNFTLGITMVAPYTDSLGTTVAHINY